MSYIFVKSSYSKDINETVLNGITLTYGTNAFSTFADAAKKAKDSDTIVVLDASVVSEANVKANVVTAYDIDEKDTKISVAAKGDLTIKKGTFAQAGEGSYVDDYDDEASAGFKNVTVEAKAKAGILVGGTIAKTFTDTAESKAFTPAGKVTVGQGAEVTSIANYQDVEIDGGKVGAIKGGVNKRTLKVDSKGVETVTESNTSKGNVIAKNGATVGNIDGFLNVTLDAVKKFENINGGSNTEKEIDGDIVSDVEKAAGKVSVIGSETTKTTGGSIEDFTDVSLDGGKGLTVDSVSTGNSNYSYNEKEGKTYSETEKKSFKAVGKFDATNVVVNGDVDGFTNVSLDGVKVAAGDISTWGFAEEIGDNFDDKYGKTDFTEYSVAITESDDKETEKVSYKLVSSGKLTAENKSTVKNIYGYKNVAIEDSTFTGEAKNAEKTISYEFTEKDRVETVKATETNKLGGSAEFVNVNEKTDAAGSVSGFANVTVENSKLLDVTNETVSKESETTVDDETTAYQLTQAVNGTIFVEAKGEVRDIKGFKTVEIDNAKVTGDIKAAEELATGNNYVTGSISVNETDTTKYERGDYKIYTGKKSTTETFKADGSVTISIDNDDKGKIPAGFGEFKDIEGFKDVTIDNIVSVGTITGGENSTNKENLSYKTAKKGSKDDVWGQTTITWDKTETYTLAGSVAIDTADKVTKVDSFKDVSMNNVKNGGDVNGGFDTKSVEKGSLVGNSKNVDFDKDEFKNHKETARTESKTSQSNVAGSFEFNSEDLEKVTAFVGNVTNVKEVSIVGNEEKKVTVGSVKINQNDSKETKSESLTQTLDADQKATAVSGKYSLKAKAEVAGFVALENATVGTANTDSISGYSEVSLTKTTVKGNVVAGQDATVESSVSVSTKGGVVTVKASSETVKESNGSLTMDKDSAIEGDIDGFNSVTIHKAAKNIKMGKTEVTTFEGEVTYDSVNDFLKGSVGGNAVKDDLSQFTANRVFEKASDYEYTKYTSTVSTGSLVATAQDDKGFIIDGKISDAADVKIKGASKTQRIKVTGEIVAQNKSTETTQEDGTKTVVDTISSVGVFEAEKFEATGKVDGYAEVELEDATVGGGIDGSTTVTTTVQTVEDGKVKDDVSKVVETISTGSFAADDSTITGAVKGYAEVELDKGKAAAFEGGNETVTTNYDKKNGDTVTTVKTAVGTFNAKNVETLGNVTGYKEVVIDGVTPATAGDYVGGNTEKVTVKDKTTVDNYTSVGSFEAYDSKAGAVSYYSEVTLSGTEAGAVVGGNKTCSRVTDDDKKDTETTVYTAAGTFEAEANKNGKKSSAAKVEGFAEVILSEFTATNAIKGGNTEEVKYAGDKTVDNYTSVGSFEAEESTLTDVTYFNEVYLSETKATGTITGGSKSWNKVTDDDKKVTETESFTAAGSFEAEEKSTLNNVTGFAEVVLTDSMVTGTIDSKNTDKVIYAGKTTVDNYTSVGSLKAENTAVADIKGYVEVGLDNESADAKLAAGAITGGSTSMTIVTDDNKDTKTEVESAMGSLTANKINSTGAIKGFETVALANSDVKDVTGGNSNKVTFVTDVTEETDTAAGSLTAEQTTMGNVDGFVDVTITGSEKDKVITYATAKAVTGGNKEYSYDTEEKESNTVVTAAGTFTGTMAKVESISGFETVVLTDSVVTTGGVKAESSDITKDSTNAEILKSINLVGSLTATTSDITGDISGFESVAISGTEDDRATFTGNAAGGITNIDKDAKVDELAVAGSFAANYVDVTGKISNFESVTLAETTVSSDIANAGYVTEGSDKVYAAAGSLTATESVLSGNIKGFAEVILTETDVTGAINGAAGTETKVESTLSLTSSEAGAVSNFASVEAADSKVASIANVTEFTATSGYSEVTGAFDDAADVKSTLTVEEGASLRIGSFGSNIGAGDTLLIEGTLVVGNAADETAAEALATVLKLAEGAGTVALNATAFEKAKEDVLKDTGTVLNLGETTEGFRDLTFESADDDKSGAVVIDDDFTGWLGNAVANDEDETKVTDKIDWVTLDLEKDDVVTFAGTGISFLKDGEGTTMTTFTATEDGSVSFKIANDVDTTSVSYKITIA